MEDGARSAGGVSSPAPDQPPIYGSVGETSPFDSNAAELQIGVSTPVWTTSSSRSHGPAPGGLLVSPRPRLGAVIELYGSDAWQAHSNRREGSAHGPSAASNPLGASPSAAWSQYARSSVGATGVSGGGFTQTSFAKFSLGISSATHTSGTGVTRGRASLGNSGKLTQLSTSPSQARGWVHPAATNSGGNTTATSSPARGGGQLAPPSGAGARALAAPHGLSGRLERGTPQYGLGPSPAAHPSRLTHGGRSSLLAVPRSGPSYRTLLAAAAASHRDNDLLSGCVTSAAAVEAMVRSSSSGILAETHDAGMALTGAVNGLLSTRLHAGGDGGGGGGGAVDEVAGAALAQVGISATPLGHGDDSVPPSSAPSLTAQAGTLQQARGGGAPSAAAGMHVEAAAFRGRAFSDGGGGDRDGGGGGSGSFWRRGAAVATAAVVCTAFRKAASFRPLSLKSPHHACFHLAWLGAFAVTLAAFAPPALLPAMGLDVSSTTAGGAAVAATLCAALACFVCAWLMRRIGPRYVQIGALLLAALALACGPLVTQAAGFVLVRCVLGASLALAVVAHAWVVAMFDFQCLTAATSAAAGMANAGGGCAMLLVLVCNAHAGGGGTSGSVAIVDGARTVLLTLGGSGVMAMSSVVAPWRATYFALAGLCILVAVLTLAFGQDTPAGDLLDPRPKRFACSDPDESSDLSFHAGASEYYRQASKGMQQEGYQQGYNPSSSKRPAVWDPELALRRKDTTLMAAARQSSTLGKRLDHPADAETPETPRIAHIVTSGAAGGISRRGPFAVAEGTEHELELCSRVPPAADARGFQPACVPGAGGTPAASPGGEASDRTGVDVGGAQPVVLARGSSTGEVLSLTLALAQVAEERGLERPHTMPLPGEQAQQEAGLQAKQHGNPPPDPAAPARAPMMPHGSSLRMVSHRSLTPELDAVRESEPGPGSEDDDLEIVNDRSSKGADISASGLRVDVYGSGHATSAYSSGKGGGRGARGGAAGSAHQAPNFFRWSAAGSSVAGTPHAGAGSPRLVQRACTGEVGEARLYGMALRNPITWLLGLSYALTMGCQLTAWNVLPRFLIHTHQLSVPAATACASVFGLTNLLARAAGAGLSEAVAKRRGMRGRLWALWALQAGAGAACALLGGAADESVGATLALLVLAGVGLQAACGVNASVAPFVSYRAYSAVMTILAAAGFLGSSALTGAFFCGGVDTYDRGFKLMGVTCCTASAGLLVIRFGPWGGPLLGPKPSARGDVWAEERYYAREWSSAERVQGFAAAAAGFAWLAKAERGPGWGKA
ncbi:hypothetical protein HYH03_010249 [Edaphochlamys debaryana]|uniref:Uncharacterized protein n=1 Tax=Edaphochlamys debaryana TaxID=47281 RepID=A0A835XWF0_9CHLO|nr:hypothetical protein HYH03_010249 [Edaphochlamys debaryana]|eukprot:KAG2491463.1 hypothetical protein HYH03_010249 [Edaphochlamys debaryana]